MKWCSLLLWIHFCQKYSCQNWNCEVPECRSQSLKTFSLQTRSINTQTWCWKSWDADKAHSIPKASPTLCRAYLAVQLLLPETSSVPEMSAPHSPWGLLLQASTWTQIRYICLLTFHYHHHHDWGRCRQLRNWSIRPMTQHIGLNHRISGARRTRTRNRNVGFGSRH